MKTSCLGGLNFDGCLEEDRDSCINETGYQWVVLPYLYGHRLSLEVSRISLPLQYHLFASLYPLNLHIGN